MYSFYFIYIFSFSKPEVAQKYIRSSKSPLIYFPEIIILLHLLSMLSYRPYRYDLSISTLQVVLMQSFECLYRYLNSIL